MTPPSQLIDVQRELYDLAEAIHRANIDWYAARKDCGDPKCGGDCRWVCDIDRTINRVLAEERP